MRSRDLLAPLGVELLSLNFTSVSPNPEVGKALEAEYRESLLRRADEAIYARRAAAVEEEGKIKSNELEGEISLARERERLIDLEAANDRSPRRGASGGSWRLASRRGPVRWNLLRTADARSPETPRSRHA